MTDFREVAQELINLVNAHPELGEFDHHCLDVAIGTLLDLDEGVE